MLNNKMTQSIGDLVAAEMSKIVTSEEHVNMFSKVAKKKKEKTSEEDDKEKKDKKSDSANPFAKKKNKKDKDKDDKEDEDETSKKKDKKSEKENPFGKKKNKGKKDKDSDDEEDDKETKDKDKEKGDEKEMTSESMHTFVNLLTKASDTLDTFGLSKSAALTLRALDTLIGEVAVQKFSNWGGPPLSGEEADLDDFEKDPELAGLMNLGDQAEDGDPDLDPMLAAELEGLDTGEPTTAFDDLEDDDDTSILEELGLSGGSEDEEDCGDLGKPLPELTAFLEEDSEARKIFGRLDTWMRKHGQEEEDLSPEDRDPGFTYGPDESYLSHPYRIHPSHQIRDPFTKTYNEFDTLSPKDRLEQEMGAGLHERLDVDPDTLSPEDLPDYDDYDDFKESEEPDGPYDPDDPDDLDARDEQDTDEFREALKAALTTDPDSEDEYDGEQDTDEFREALKAALTTDPDLEADEHSDDDGDIDSDFEDEDED